MLIIFPHAHSLALPAQTSSKTVPDFQGSKDEEKSFQTGITLKNKIITFQGLLAHSILTSIYKAADPASLGSPPRGECKGEQQQDPHLEPARLSSARRGTLGLVCPSVYLVIVQPRLQDLVQLPRKRVVALSGVSRGPIALGVGRRRGRYRYFPAALGHGTRTTPAPGPGKLFRRDPGLQNPGQLLRMCRASCACALNGPSLTAHLELTSWKWAEKIQGRRGGHRLGARRAFQEFAK